MNFQWILLAFFLVAIISGMSKSLSKSMLKNCLRLGAVVIAFLITFVLQICGVFQGIVVEIINLVNLIALVPALAGAMNLVIGLASTLVSPIFFTIVFFLILWVLRIIIHFVVKAIEKKQEAKAALKAEGVEPAVVAESEVASETAVSESSEVVTESTAELSEESVPADTVTEEAPVVTKAENVPEVDTAPKKEKTKKKNKAFYPECAWKRVVSIATGVISGILVLSISLMPVFYTMSIVSTATDAMENSDAKDSQIYQILDVVDEYIATPYEESFVAQFYDSIGISNLMNYTIKVGGKIVLDSGEVVYADDVLKNVLSNGVSIAAQVLSAESECPTVKKNLEAVLKDPMISSLIADLLIDVIKDFEIEQADESDILAGIVNNFMLHYKEADKATIEKDLKALGGALGILAEKGIVLQLVAGNADIETLLEDEETLRGVVKAISSLSAFGPTIEGAFELGIEILASTLGIPATREEAYAMFIEHIIDATNGEVGSGKFTYSEVESFIKYCAENGKKYTNNNKHSGYDDFVAYMARWSAIQLAFGHSGEDRSFGDFTFEIDGKLYILKSNRFQAVPEAPSADAPQKDIDKYNRDYTKRISPVADLIHYIAKNAGTSANEGSLKLVVSDYLRGSSISLAGKDAAEMIVNEDYSKLDAVTVEKMLAATDFKDWTDEEKASDSEKCIDIIFNLLGMMDMLGSDGGSQDMEALIGQLSVVGQTMDYMRETTCIKELAPLLLEGLMSNEMFSMIPIYTAYNYNDAVVSGAIHSQTGNPTTYTDIMNDLLKLFESMGGIIK